MSNGRWCTKEDVLQDLAKATGMKINNIDNNFFVFGENPPPPILCNNEDKILLSNVLKTNNNEIKPDLRGITQMLRLVKDHCGSTENVDNVKICTKSPNPHCDISISKLNPNVKEFIPKCTTLPSVNSSKDKVIDDMQDGSNCVCSDQGQISDSKSGEENVKEITIENNMCSELKILNGLARNNSKDSEEVDINKNSVECSINLKSKETEAIASVLKNKITLISASKTNTFQAKKERNVALANLQKLYSMPTNQKVDYEAEKPVKKAIKLITPDFFEKSKAEDNMSENKQQNGLTNHTGVYSLKEPVIEKCQFLTIVKEKFGSLKSLETIDHSNRIINEVNSPDLELLNAEKFRNSETVVEKSTLDSEVNNLESNTTHHDNCFTIQLNTSDPEIQNSIKKVKNWFSKADEKPKGPVLYLNPVSFKRKDVTNCQSPNEIDKKISKPTTIVTQQYKPTKYASELSKMYMERVKNKELENEKVTWENLNTELKKKDEKIRQATSKDSSLASSTAELTANVNINTQ